MKNKKITYFILPTLLTFAFAFVIGINYAAASTDSTKEFSELDTVKMKDININIEHPNIIAKVEKAVAIASASKAFPQWAQDAKNVKVEYHLITNDSFELFSEQALSKNPDLKLKKHMDKTPAYIVSFVGMNYEGKVSPGSSEKTKSHHEYNVIVDAMTGEALMAFSNR